MTTCSAITEKAPRIAKTADTDTAPKAKGASAPGRQAQTQVLPGFEPLPAAIRPLGDRRPVAQAAEPAWLASADSGEDVSVAAFWAY